MQAVRPQNGKNCRFFNLYDAGTPLAKWLKRDQWALVSSNEGLRK
jgi:hypothetical protein